MKLPVKHILQFFKKRAFFFTLLVVAINIVLGGWTVFNNDILYKSDVARDFLLFDELSQKGFILLGPRASGLQGLFHGPLWVYLNYPAYVIGQGNPIVVGYFWILLNILFLVSSYIVAKKLFNHSVANVYVILLSAASIFYVNSLFNPYGAMIVMPIFLYTIIRYSQTLQWKYLLFNLLALGAIIQFQMAVGLPLLLLTALYALFIIWKNKLFKHLLVVPILILPFSTFILFDLRHEFGQFNAIVQSFTTESSNIYISYADRIVDRWESMTKRIFFAQGNFSGIINEIVSLFLIFFAYTRLRAKGDKKNEHRHIIFTILYFYIGFYLITILFNGLLLLHYTFPVIPLLFLLFSSMILYMNKKVFFTLLIFLILVNIHDGIIHAQTFVKAKGTELTSWHFQSQAAKKVFDTAKGEFGYFLYAPDYHAYAQKYAFVYTNTLYPNKKAFLFEKKPVVYTVVEPAPEGRADLDDTYWIKSMVKIESKPKNVTTYPNGFTIKEYILTEEELKVSPDPQTADWLKYR
ncbi:MAG: hypothetical protein H0W89_00295 [Candidatus Levybacteria bacterium]|nr:hypothetical protein [Candidatus Levybacteria bacterium]